MRTLSEEKRQAIIDAALQLFQEMGYERTSMNEVAKRVGGSKATLYNYFRSKEELFKTVVRNYSTRFLTEAAFELDKTEQGEFSLEEKLMRFGERLLVVLTSENQALQIYRIVLGEAGHSDIGKLFVASGPEEAVEKLSALMEASMQKGELKSYDAKLRSVQFLALVKAEVDGLLLQRQPPRLTLAQIRQMSKDAVTLFLTGAAVN